ncbi:fimbrial protein [Pragia fontium]|uniref:fimbrial protein n=1 Tax=Pragia fontium TaxID=82985 RepID=UPI000649DE8E|nr:fimbrial protein [Pragia fontium]AKJ43418.1 fimbria A protein [Pragia fontium]
MKLNKIVLAVSLAFGVASFAQAADQGHGTITFTGSIIDAPCSIAPETADQTVDLGQVANTALTANSNTGTSVPRDFGIRLEKCSLASGEDAKNTVTATFTGQAGGTAGSLGLRGTAKGASIVMADADGAAITLGAATAVQPLSADGDTTLKFTAYLQGDGASGANAIVPGDFTSEVKFVLAYQ